MLHTITHGISKINWLGHWLFFAVALLGVSAVRPAQAQAPPAWQTALTATGASGSSSFVWATAPDAAGNVFIAGGFLGTIQLGNTTLTSAGSQDIFVAKWAPATNSFVWAERAGGSAIDVASSIAVSGSNVYVTGYTTSPTADFGSVQLTQSGAAPYDRNVFVTKLTDAGASGRFTWAQLTYGYFNSTAAIAASGSALYLTGAFVGTATFGPFQRSSPDPNYYSVFVAKLTDTGSGAAFNWVEQSVPVASRSGGEAYTIAVQGTHVYLAGNFFGALQFGTRTVNSAGGYDIFAARLTDTGTAGLFDWVQRAGGSADEHARGAVLSAGTLFIAGHFMSSAMPVGASTLTNLSTPAPNAFLAKLTDTGSAGTFVWGEAVSGNDAEMATGVAVNGADVYVSGSYSSSTATIGSASLINAGGTDGFVAKFTDAGNTSRFAWAKSMGGSGFDLLQALTFTGSRLVAAGELTPPVALDTHSVSGPAGVDVAFVGTLLDAPPTVTILNPTDGTAGDAITLEGTNLTGTTSIAFTGTSNQVVTGGFLVNAAGTQITGIVVPDGARTGPITVRTPGGTAASPQVFTVISTWTGAVSTDWATPGNWRGGAVPTRTERAAVPTAVRNPLVSGSQEANVLGLFGTGTVTIADNSSLSLYGDVPEGDGQAGMALVVSNSGTDAVRAQPTPLHNGVLRFVGANRQKIDARSGSQYHFDNVYVGPAGVQLYRVSMQLHGTLTLAGDVNGANSLARNNEPLVLVSNSSGTALVVHAGGQFVGPVTVQRYLSPAQNPGLGYRHLSSPVQRMTVADLALGGVAPTVNAAYNSSPTPHLVTPFPTVFGYDQARLTSSPATSYSPFDKGWFSPASTGDVLQAGRGYTVGLPGGRTVDFVGQLTNGDLALSFARGPQAEAGWQLVGNPYAAPLDWSRVAAADRRGLMGAVYVYESTGPYVGRYRSYVNGLGNPIVPLGQAFFVRVADSATTAGLTFRNAQRLTASDATPLLRTTADTRPQLQLNLHGAGTADVAYVYFEAGATSGIDAEYDAPKIPNSTGLNLAVLAGSRLLAVSGLPPLTATDRMVNLHVQAPQAGSYTLRAAELLNLPAGAYTYLRDAQTGAVVDLQVQPSYAFTLSSTVPATGRFSLLLTQNRVTASGAPAALSQQVGLYPNPARGSVMLSLPATIDRQPVAVSVLNALGQQVLTRALPAARSTAQVALPLSGLAKGVYTVRLITPLGLMTKRLVVE